MTTAEERARGPVVRAVVTDVLIAALQIGAAFVPFGGPLAPAADGLRAVPLLAAGAVALPFRRRWPVQSFIACVVIACVGALIGLDTPAFVLPVAVCMFAVAASRDRRTTVLLAAGAAVVLPLVSLVNGPSLSQYPAAFLSARAVQLAAIVAFAAAAGGATRARRATLAAYADRAARAEQSREAEARHRVAEDRLAIARDLHDLVAHQIAVINLNAGVASRAVRDRPAEAEESLRVIGEASRSVITEIGELLALLRAPGDDPAAVTPPAGLQRLDALIDLFEQHGLRVAQHREGDPATVPPEVGSVAYRVIQEGLTNAHKHGADSAVRLAMTTDAQALRIELDNRTDAWGGTPVAGHGLTGMRERVAALGGALDAAIGDDGRFRLVARLPLARLPVTSAAEVVR
ncbi:sensor histidine kinase [uncultured Amnibacterium sp.]|uniref:sensor histidine kinase n=1 Tax=uncultured Amnibacterium sp. TaxID=1631851 RepID=UPI0035C9A4B4